MSWQSEWRVKVNDFFKHVSIPHNVNWYDTETPWKNKMKQEEKKFQDISQLMRDITVQMTVDLISKNVEVGKIVTLIMAHKERYFVEEIKFEEFNVPQSCENCCEWKAQLEIAQSFRKGLHLNYPEYEKVFIDACDHIQQNLAKNSHYYEADKEILKKLVNDIQFEVDYLAGDMIGFDSDSKTYIDEKHKRIFDLYSEILNLMTHKHHVHWNQLENNEPTQLMASLFIVQLVTRCKKLFDSLNGSRFDFNAKTQFGIKLVINENLRKVTEDLTFKFNTYPQSFSTSRREKQEFILCDILSFEDTKTFEICVEKPLLMFLFGQEHSKTIMAL